MKDQVCTQIKVVSLIQLFIILGKSKVMALLTVKRELKKVLI